MNVKNLVLGLGIFIVFLLMLFFGIETFYPSPKWDKFCNQSIYTQPMPYGKLDGSYYNPSLEEQANSCVNQKGTPIYQYNSTGYPTSIKECNMCQKEFDEAISSYDKKVFLISLIAGIIVFLIGYTILSIEPVGSSLMAGGIGAIVIGTARNWQNLSSIWRFLILLAALVLLIWIALRMNKNIKSTHSRK